jgi:hypothetical protein
MGGTGVPPFLLQAIDSSKKRKIPEKQWGEKSVFSYLQSIP